MSISRYGFHEKGEPNAWNDDDGKHYPDRTFDELLAKQAIETLKENKKIEIVSIKEGKSNDPLNLPSQLIQCYRLQVRLLVGRYQKPVL